VTYIERVADRLLARLLRRPDREIPHTTTLEGAREALHVLTVRAEIERADQAFKRTTAAPQG
jgi:hypothetical protein